MTDPIEISNIDERGMHATTLDIKGVPDLDAGVYAGLNDGVTFAPDHIRLEFTWSTGRGTIPPRGWHLTVADVSGYRRLRNGELGKERKRSSFVSRMQEAPAWLMQLIRVYTPSYPVGVALGGKLPVLMDLAELEAQHRG